MSLSKDEAGESSLPRENGFLDRVSPANLEKALGDLRVETPVHNTDDHLIEFSEALRTVAKALRRAAEGKVSAQAEAAEWKHKYELERARNKQLELIEDSCERQNGSVASSLTGEIPGPHPMVDYKSNGQPERCCAGDGICSHEILFDSEAGSLSGYSQNKMKRKASFKLSWRCKGERSNQYKHDIVSFEKGNISTAGRTSKQISLKWESPPQTVLILTKPNSASVRVICLEMVRWLKEQKNINVYVEPRVKSELLNASSFFGFVKTWQDESEISPLHAKVDLVVTLGGDGTVLWAASMFKGPVPPIVPFSLGSLGFMTPFCMLHLFFQILYWQFFAYFSEICSYVIFNISADSERYRECLDAVLKGPISITLRHRLQCHVIRDSATSDYETEGPILVLNEVTIDRGISSYLTNLECYCDNSFVTSVQGDGLILSTTSGSTAYSLAAGGSMVHPQVPGILFTPICPHSLSFRPLILPEHVTLRVQVPFNSRSPAWASFDGKDSKQLAAGDALVCSMAPWPVPTACLSDSTADFLQSIQDGLHWNLRKTQSFDGPREQL